MQKYIMVFSPPTILLGEDNPADVYLIRQALEMNEVPYVLQLASHGGEVKSALTSAGLSLPDLIVLDLNLPRYDGLELLGLIRNSEQWREIPVVILTSSDSPKDRIAASQLGADCYIRKPSKLEDFMAIGKTLRAMLRGECQKTATSAT